MSELFYFASPMCSWCWGFSPVVKKIKQAFPEKNIRLVLTPFRVDTTEAMDDRLRNYVLGQWQKVHQTTGQPFDFRFSMPDNFIYNTSLVCLAIKVFKKQAANQELQFMHVLQENFYTQNKDITNQKVLLEIAEAFAIDTHMFSSDLGKANVVKELQEDFILCQQLAVTSYPTLMIKTDENYTVLANGYASFEDIQSGLEID